MAQTNGMTNGEGAKSLDALTQQLSEEVSNYKDPSGNAGLLQRKKILNAAKQIIDEVKEPGETPFEYSISMAEMGALRLLMEWGTIDHIPNEGSISYKDLAEKVGAEEELIARMCWILVSTGILKQIGEDHVAHTKFSHIYTGDNPQGAFFQIMFDEGMIAYTKWTDFFDTYGRKVPTKWCDIPYSFAWGEPEKNFWDVIARFPKRQSKFNTSMATLDEVLPVMGMFDFNWIVQNASKVADDAALIVDVGGGKGQALQQIRKHHPDIPADRCVLQDRSVVIDEVNSLDQPGLRGVKTMPHNFFEEQPVKGALVYWVRRIMHDWGDENNSKILRHLANAMTANSRVLLCDQVMANPPSGLSAQTDLCMMNLGGKERTKKNWAYLVDISGLKLLDIHMTPGTDVAIIECGKAV